LTLVTFTACVPKRDASNSSNPTSANSTDDERIAALEAKVSQLQSRIASLPASSGNYDADIDSLQAQIDDMQMQLDDILIEVNDTLAAWEEVQKEQADATTPDLAETTKWDLDVWTDYESFDLLEASLDCETIEDEDDYTIWLVLNNTNIKSAYLGKLPTEPSTTIIGSYYYNTTFKKMYQYTDTWNEVNPNSIYQEVEIKGINIEFSPKGSNRVIVDESRTELYSSGYPSFGWETDFSNRADGTCKRIEAITSARFILPAPSRFRDNDPEQPYPTQFKLEFELAYK